MTASMTFSGSISGSYDAASGTFYATNANTATVNQNSVSFQGETIEVGAQVTYNNQVGSFPFFADTNNMFAFFQGYYYVDSVEYPLLAVNGTYTLLGQQSVGSYAITAAAFNQPVCYVQGTRIRTARGEIPVEDLKVGDHVPTRFSGLAEVRWIGRQRVSDAVVQNSRTPWRPIRIRAGALEEAIPSRDLLVSPHHSMLIDGFLVAARDIVNGVSIVEEDRLEAVSYFHIDLGPHDCLLAESAWSESYAEQNNRHRFDNAADHAAAKSGPGFAPMCVERVTAAHPALPAIIATIIARIPDAYLTTNADLHLLADGKRIEPARRDGWETQFRLPGVPRELRLLSRAARLLRLGLGQDDRQLGFFLHQLRIVGAATRVVDGGYAGFGDGFHAPEAGWRWTNGSALLPASLFEECAGDFTLTVIGRGLDRYIAPQQPVPPTEIVRQAA